MSSGVPINLRIVSMWETYSDKRRGEDMRRERGEEKRREREEEERERDGERERQREEKRRGEVTR